MLVTYLFFATHLSAAKTKINDRMRPEDGVTTLEWIILTLGVFLVAGAAVAVITAAINSRMSQIN